MSKANHILLKATNIIAFVLTVIVNSLAGSTTLIGGKTTADISNLYPTLITPAGYVFAIWGVIYLPSESSLFTKRYRARRGESIKIRLAGCSS
jgi:hypothetical protein